MAESQWTEVKSRRNTNRTTFTTPKPMVTADSHPFRPTGFRVGVRSYREMPAKSFHKPRLVMGSTSRNGNSPVVHSYPRGWVQRVSEVAKCHSSCAVLTVEEAKKGCFHRMNMAINTTISRNKFKLSY